MLAKSLSKHTPHRSAAAASAAGNKRSDYSAHRDEKAALKRERYQRYKLLTDQLVETILSEAVGDEAAEALIRGVKVDVLSPTSAIRKADESGRVFTEIFSYFPPGANKRRPELRPDYMYWAGYSVTTEEAADTVICGKFAVVTPPTIENRGVPLFTLIKGTMAPHESMKADWDGIADLRANGVTPVVDLLNRYLRPLKIHVYDQFYPDRGNVLEAVWEEDEYAAHIDSVRQKFSRK